MEDLKNATPTGKRNDLVFHLNQYKYDYISPQLHGVILQYQLKKEVEPMLLIKYKPFRIYVLMGVLIGSSHKSNHFRSDEIKISIGPHSKPMKIFSASLHAITIFDQQ